MLAEAFWNVVIYGILYGLNKFVKIVRKNDDC